MDWECRGEALGGIGGRAALHSFVPLATAFLVVSGPADTRGQPNLPASGERELVYGLAVDEDEGRWRLHACGVVHCLWL